MKPTHTSYTLATSSKDYAECHALELAETGAESHAYSFPTVIARRDGEVIGFFATIPPDKYVIAGPLVIKGGRNPVVAMRLIEAYDVVMRRLGIQLYYFTVDATRTDALSLERMQAVGMQHWETRDGITWMKREL